MSGNVNIRDSMITKSTKIIIKKMKDIEQVRRRRMYEKMMNEDENEEDIISSKIYIDMKNAESLDLSVITLTALREIYDDLKVIFKSEE